MSLYRAYFVPRRSDPYGLLGHGPVTVTNGVPDRAKFIKEFTDAFAGLTATDHDFGNDLPSIEIANGKATWDGQEVGHVAANKNQLIGFMSSRAQKAEEALRDDLKGSWKNHENSNWYQFKPDVGYLDGPHDGPPKSLTVYFKKLKPKGKEAAVAKQVKDRVAAVAGYAYDQGVCELTIDGEAHTYPSNAGLFTFITSDEETTADVGTNE